MISASAEVVEMLRILFELSRTDFNPTGARALAGVDIHAFEELAVRNRIAALVSYYMGFQGSHVPHALGMSAVALEAKAERRRAFARYLVIRRLELDLFRPRGINHAFLKGSIIDSTLYGGRFLRQSSDIDILVEPKDVRQVVDYLLQDGYSLSHEGWIGHPLSAVCEYAAVVEMRNEAGIQLEIHKSLDEHSIVFPPLSKMGVVREKVGDIEFPGLPEPVRSLYMIFHHSRHKWSCLHWVMDLIRFCKGLDAVARSGLLTAAEKIGLRRTLEESFKLEQDLAAIAAGGQPDPSTASLFTAECVHRISLDEVATAALKAREIATEPDFAFAWQHPVGYTLKVMLHRLRPGENEYRLVPSLAGSKVALYMLRSATLVIHFVARLSRVWRR